MKLVARLWTLTFIDERAHMSITDRPNILTLQFASTVASYSA